MLLRYPLVLASASPRRKELLGQLGLTFEVITSRDEPFPEQGESPRDYVRRAAEYKANDVLKSLGERMVCVLAADTIVVLDDVIFGKPQHDDEALHMVSALSGRWHHVLTAVVARGPGQGRMGVKVLETRVKLREASRETLERYIQSGEGKDKAGSYAIQGLGAGLVQAIEGSYSNVVGLPTVETLELLSEIGVLETWP